MSGIENIEIKMVLNKTALDRRNKEIVERIEAGTAPAELARFFDMSRERIRQIYKKATGINPKVTLYPIRAQRKKAKLEAKLNEEFKCLVCLKIVLRRNEKFFQKYCYSCRQRQKTEWIRFSHKRKCDFCKKEYYPYGQSVSFLKRGITKHAYCSQYCYKTSRKGVPLSESHKLAIQQGKERSFARERELQIAAERLLQGMQSGNSLDGEV